MVRLRNKKIFLKCNIRLVQMLLNIKENIDILFLSLLILKIFLIVTLLGMWVLLSGLIKVITIGFLLLIIFLLLARFLKRFSFININKTILWIEDRNSQKLNPITAHFDTPGNYSFNKEKWDYFKRENIENLKKIKFYMPGLGLNEADPLRVRYLLFVLLITSYFLAIKNNTLQENILSIVNFEFKQRDISEDQITGWATPPRYTGVAAVEITEDLNRLEKEKILSFPSGTKLNFKIFSSGEKFYLTYRNKKMPFELIEKNNFEARFILLEDDRIKIENKNEVLKSLKLVVIKDKKPSINFLRKPEIVNDVSIKFSSLAQDDYGIKKIYINIDRPEEFSHFQDKSLYLSLPLEDQLNPRRIESFFYKNLSSLIWAGHRSKIRLFVSDDLNQVNEIVSSITLPTKMFYDASAKKIIEVRKNIALKKISIENANKSITQIFSAKQEKLYDPEVIKLKKRIKKQLSLIKIRPILLNDPLYDDIWDLALMVEEGKKFLVKDNLEQIEQSLFDSINKRDTDKISSDARKMQESLQTLLDLNSQYDDENKQNTENDMSLKNEVNKLTKELQDLLKTGSKENLDKKIQKLRELSDSLKNPGQVDNEKKLRHEKKKDFINRLSELLNEQEIVMEESFNRAADRGKFEQSSEGSGGKSPKEKQDNLRNTLGNIIREIGQSENEIPQELARADRAMRQASKDLEGGRPDRASNAQGRALEMIQRSMNKMNSEMNTALSKNLEGEEKENNIQNNANFNNDEGYEYQGTALGGRLDIPKEFKIRKSKIIAEELYSRYNENEREDREKEYIKKLLDWY